MIRPFAVLRTLSLVVLAAGAVSGVPGRSAWAADHAPWAPGSCTDDAGAGLHHGRRHASGAACGPRGCGPARCGHGHCCPQPCCPGAGCHGACCRGLCEQLGHSVHHDVYEKRYFLRSQGKSRHSTWYDPAEGRPIALVVPPTAEFQSQYAWGVPSSRVAPIYHQFRRPYPGPGGVAGSGGGFLPTPNQPSDTVQFGVNAVRGPWGAY
ncbi:MAG: hypothetical protein ACKON7_12320 [Planctomycetaceae bacterium]